MSDSSTQQSAQSATTKTFVTALYLNAAVFGIELVAFTLLRRRFKAIYEPRTYLPPENKRSSPLGSGLLTWPIAVFKANYDDIKYMNGLDAYFFVRFLRMMVKMLLPIWIISWIILLPVTSVGENTGRSGLDKFTFGNISTSDQPRYAAHLVLVWLFTFWILYVIKGEMRNFTQTRQRHLIDPLHSRTAQANTLLITGVPTKYLSEQALTNLFAHLPGGVRKVWVNRDLGTLPSLYDRRLKACNKLESAETKLLKLATKMHKKQLKAAAKEDQKASGKLKKGTASGSPSMHSSDPERLSVSNAEQLVPENKRPSHRLPAGFMPFSLPLIGKKVDTINWARDEIEKTSSELDSGRAKLRSETGLRSHHAKRVGFAGVIPGHKHHGHGGAQDATATNSGEVPGRASNLSGDTRGHHSYEKPEYTQSEKPYQSTTTASVEPASSRTTAGTDARLIGDAEDGDNSGQDETYPPLNSAFILFNTQIAAHLAAQALTHHEPYRMADKYTEVAPADVLWNNLGLNPYEKKIRLIVSYAATAGLIILWAIPVAFVGIVSNIGSLCKTYSWLSWLCSIPPTVLGIVEGILPPVLLAVLMMLLPIILRRLAQFEGIPSRTGVELSLMTRYFLFQVIHSFLIVTIASGIIAALPGLLSNPGSVPTLLAKYLPQASNFFLTYIILQGLSGTAAGFLQIVPLISYYAKLFILGSTPRSVYNIKYNMRNVAWGTLFPATTLLAVITITYSVISPIINGLACFTFFVFYLLWKYLFLYQLDQPASGDTGGIFFPKAIQHVFVGLYIQQICLAALFFLAQNANKKQSAIPEGALMIVLIVATAIFHMILNNSYSPLRHPLPLSLADKTHGVAAHPDDSSSATAVNHGQLTDGDQIPAPRYGSHLQGNNAAQKQATAAPQAVGQGSVRLKETDYDHQRSVPVEGKQNDEPGDFFHPASVEPLRVIWIPEDTLGLCEREVEDNRSMGIEASSENARMDAKGHVDIDGCPPGMDEF